MIPHVAFSNPKLKPEAKPTSGFNKAAALDAAINNRLNRNQLLAIIDRSRHLCLTKSEVSVFEDALSLARPTPTYKVNRVLPVKGRDGLYDEPYAKPYDEGDMPNIGDGYGDTGEGGWNHDNY